MELFQKLILPTETDCWNQLRPSDLFQLMIGAAGIRASLEGMSRQRLLEEKQATWMIGRMELRQYLPLYGEETVSVHCSARREVGTGYIRFATVYRGQEKAAECSMLFLAVDVAKRTAIRPAELESMCTWEASKERLPTPRRIPPIPELPALDRHVVRWNECDVNGHFAGVRYIDVICNAIDYWQLGRRIQTLHVDYMHECVAGMEIVTCGEIREEEAVVYGKTEDGQVAFRARAVFAGQEEAQ
ncbi:MAG: hypothetical protein ACOX7K_01455 [Oscillospiraceae bacterium]|jgi:acyl-ACP thioesterase